MQILSATALKKEYGTDVIFDEVSFHMEKGEKIGIVGPNGAGKSTLLKVLAGELETDAGSCRIHPEIRLGYLAQQSDIPGEGTIRDEVARRFSHLEEMERELQRIAEAIPEAEEEERHRLLRQQAELSDRYKEQGGYSYRSEIKGILASMAFPESQYDQPIAALSGGEKTRLALALLLLEKPDLMLLDEPTNHLDIGTLQWLEQYLGNYRGSLLVVSHDRYFLDRLCGRILEVEGGRLRSFPGNYSAYAKRKRELLEEDLRHSQAFERERKRQEELVRRFKERGTEKLAKRAQSREKKLEKMAREERAQKPRDSRRTTGRMKLQFKEEYKSGSDVLLLEELAKGFGFGARRKELFAHVALDLKRGERLCLVGANGIGKTTLLRILLGELQPDAGRLKWGHNVKPVYYDQEQRLLNENNSVLEELWEDHPDMSGTELRSILGSFLFRGDDVFLPVRALSGGEKARLSLLKLMMGGGNLLLLDEPTNHLDIASREVFEDALLEFPGTALIISHDRYFLNKVPTRIAELTEDGLQNYLGKYDYYQEKKASLASSRSYMKELARQGRQESPDGASPKAAGTPDASGTSIATAGTPDASGTSIATAGTTAGTPGMAGDSPGASGNGPGTLGTTIPYEVGTKEERAAKKQAEAAARRLAREKAALEEEISTLEERIAATEEEMCLPEVQEDLSRLQELSAALEEDKARLEQVYEEWMQYE